MFSLSLSLSPSLSFSLLSLAILCHSPSQVLFILASFTNLNPTLPTSPIFLSSALAACCFMSWSSPSLSLYLSLSPSLPLSPHSLCLSPGVGILRPLAQQLSLDCVEWSGRGGMVDPLPERDGEKEREMERTRWREKGWRVGGSDQALGPRRMRTHLSAQRRVCVCVCVCVCVYTPLCNH